MPKCHSSQGNGDKKLNMLWHSICPQGEAITTPTWPLRENKTPTAKHTESSNLTVIPSSPSKAQGSKHSQGPHNIRETGLRYPQSSALQAPAPFVGKSDFSWGYVYAVPRRNGTKFQHRRVGRRLGWPPVWGFHGNFGSWQLKLGKDAKFGE